MPHPLEGQYGLSANELLDALNKRFRAKVALEGVVAERHLLKIIQKLKRQGAIVKFEEHDKDDYPDFSVWIGSRTKPLKIECKNVRNHREAYREVGKIVAYKVETQKTRAAKGDPTSRNYDVNQFDILAVCLGKKTGNWREFLFIATTKLKRLAGSKKKLAAMQRVPLPSDKNLGDWSKGLADIFRVWR
jgi:hypothetical protein